MERYMKRLVFPALWGWAVALSLAGCSEDNGPQAVPETGQPETVKLASCWRTGVRKL